LTVLSGAHLKEFRHQRFRGSAACKLRVVDYRVINTFDVAANILHLITMGHRSKVYRDL
jgi:mRNA-degrading endonuclease RelE of RelBE toxin-antitoxin system